MSKRPKTVMLTLRIPVELRTALRTAAKGDHRSVTSQVAETETETATMTVSAVSVGIADTAATQDRRARRA